MLYFRDSSFLFLARIGMFKLKEKINQTFITLAVLYRSVKTNGGVHLGSLAPVQHSFKETSQRWRGVGDTVYDFTCSEIEPKVSAPMAMSLTTTTTGRLFKFLGHKVYLNAS